MGFPKVSAHVLIVCSMYESFLTSLVVKELRSLVTPEMDERINEDIHL